MFDFLDPIIEFASNLFGSVGDAASSAGQTAASFYPSDAISSAGSFVGSHPLETLSLAGQGLGLAGQFMGGGGQPQMPANLEGQLQGAAPAQVAGVRRQTLGDLQSQGLSGASPDFLASQMGLTPEELDQMMRRGGGA